MAKQAILFGLEYLGQPGELRGCKRDTEDMANHLKEKQHYDKVRVFTSDYQTGAQYMLYNIYKLALKTWRDRGIKEVCIYYSGHGSNIHDRDGDEREGLDECLVPTDYRRAGVITDDLLKRVFRCFHADVNVVFICDACHSGSMCDLKFKYDEERDVCEEAHPHSRCAARVVSISGCKDEQVSYVGFDLRGEQKRRSVLTALLIKTLEEDHKRLKDVSKALKRHVKDSGYKQDPEVMTSFVVSDGDELFK